MLRIASRGSGCRFYIYSLWLQNQNKQFIYCLISKTIQVVLSDQKITLYHVICKGQNNLRSRPPMYLIVISQWPHTAETMGYSFLPFNPRNATPKYWPSTTNAKVPSSMSRTTVKKKYNSYKNKSRHIFCFRTKREYIIFLALTSKKHTNKFTKETNMLTIKFIWYDKSLVIV